MIGIAFWVASAIGGGYVAYHKGRSPIEGIVFGVVFGPLGMLTMAGLPARSPESRRRARSAASGADQGERDLVRAITERFSKTVSP
ncbi:hypothetical protein [Aquisphaera giovannonii]|nr:hypothetical protein [Aquisphaera giovannonii]